MTIDNGKKLSINTYGNFVDYINNYKFILKNVYYSKDIKKNIISLKQLISQKIQSYIH